MPLKVGKTIRRCSSDHSSTEPSRSIALGIFAIVRMGAVYWQALIIFVTIGAVSLLVSYVLGLVAPLGLILGPFVKTYAALAIGCTLGLAVFKRAAQLELS